MKIQQSVIIQTFRHVVPQIHELVDRHFDLLTKIYPHFVVKFEGKNLKHISNQFINTLIFAVDNLEDPAMLAPFFERLGKKHKAVGVTQEDLSLFQETFIRTLASFLKEKWTPRATENWNATFVYLSNFMRGSMNLPPGPEVSVLVKGEKQAQSPAQEKQEEDQGVEGASPSEEKKEAPLEASGSKDPAPEQPALKAPGPAPEPASASAPQIQVPPSDIFTPYSREFFDSVTLEVEADLTLSQDQQHRIREIAGKLAKELVNKHWKQSFDDALDDQLEDLEEKKKKSSRGSKAA